MNEKWNWGKGMEQGKCELWKRKMLHIPNKILKNRFNSLASYCTQRPDNPLSWTHIFIFIYVGTYVSVGILLSWFFLKNLTNTLILWFVGFLWPSLHFLVIVWTASKQWGHIRCPMVIISRAFTNSTL